MSPVTVFKELLCLEVYPKKIRASRRRLVEACIPLCVKIEERSVMSVVNSNFDSMEDATLFIKWLRQHGLVSISNGSKFKPNHPHTVARAVGKSDEQWIRTEAAIERVYESLYKSINIKEKI